jgi:hypothetical protein
LPFKIALKSEMEAKLNRLTDPYLPWKEAGT